MRVTTLLCVAAALVVSHTAPAAATALSPSPTTPSVPTATPTTCFESVGGCCDFGGRQPCYQLLHGQDESRCRYGDGGNPVGCNFNVICNASTGLCEAAVPTPTPEVNGCGQVCDGRVCTGPCGACGQLAYGRCIGQRADGCECVTECTPCPAPSNVPTPTATPAPCAGDCDSDGRVTVDEILTGINIDLGNTPISACPAFSCPPCTVSSCQSGVDCILEAVNNALTGCPPTPTPVTITYTEKGVMNLFPTPGSNSAQLLWGTFSVIVTEPGAPNAPFHFILTNLAFQSKFNRITGSAGDIEATLSGAQGRVTMTAPVSINEQAVELRGDAPFSVLSGYPPTFNGLELCGAPGRSVTCDAVHAGTDSGYQVFIDAVPNAPQTPAPTPTPAPASLIRYRLTTGSTILSSPAPPGINTSTYEEPLSGTLVVAPCPPPFIPGMANTTVCLYVTTAALQSTHFTFSVSAGGMSITTFDPTTVFMYLIGTINGQALDLTGVGPTDAGSYPPTLGALEICGAPPGVGGSCAGIRAGTDVGYDLIIFAAPDP